MTGSVHAAIGAAIGRFCGTRQTAFWAGVLSHLIGDVVPHGDFGYGEAPLVALTVLHIGKKHGFDSPQFWGAIGGICPDFEHILWEHLPKEKQRDMKLFPTHNHLIPHGEKRGGLVTQVALWVAGLAVADSAPPKRTPANGSKAKQT